MPDWLRRALRTTGQTAVATLVVVLPASPPDDIPATLATAATVAGWSALVGAVSAIHNALEDKGVVRDRR